MHPAGGPSYSTGVRLEVLAPASKGIAAAGWPGSRRHCQVSHIKGMCGKVLVSASCLQERKPALQHL